MAIILQKNSKKRLALWVTTGIISITHIKKEQQSKQGWLNYLMMRYNCYKGKRPTSIASTSKITPIRYKTHSKDIKYLKIQEFTILKHQFVPQFLYQAQQIPNLF